jgi:biotin synthase
MSDIRNDWSVQEISEIYHSPLLDLVYRAATVHRQFHQPSEVQVCTLLSVKTGGCPEDCAYCPQAARYHTDVKAHKLLDVDTVLGKAREAKDNGSTRFCMGAAWREIRENKDFDKVLEMVKGVNELGMEVCCTMGMVTENQASRLKDAGLHAYNHNLDTSEEHYSKIISTRTYDDRLQTIGNVRKAGISVCSGGIIGLGETHESRIGILYTLATLPEHPESVPVNALVAVAGTPLENMARVPVFDMVRMIATARILMPSTMVRLLCWKIRYANIRTSFLLYGWCKLYFCRR